MIFQVVNDIIHIFKYDFVCFFDNMIFVSHLDLLENKCNANKPHI